MYGVERAPSDACLRERLDSVSPNQLRRPFKKIFSYWQRGKALESYRYLNGHYIIYGHGYKNLCSVMTMLMMLSFLIDHVQQLCCKTYQKARTHAGRLTTLVERVRVLTGMIVFNSWEHLYTFIGVPESRPPPEPMLGS